MAPAKQLSPPPSSLPQASATSTSLPIGVVLSFWFVLSTLFNNVTPHLMSTLTTAGGHSVDLTLIELAITVAIAGTKLKAQGLRALPPCSKAASLLLVGTLHLVGCRLFVYGLSLGLPISLAQTIRAANPLFVVLLEWLQGRRHELSILLTLCPIILGFSLAVADASSANLNPVAIACSLGSVACLVCVNSLAQRMATTASGVGPAEASPPSPAELQCWVCEVALACLVPFWVLGGGAPRLSSAFVASDGDIALRLAGLCVLDGAFYFSEQIAQMIAIATLSPLTLAVVDTVRRLFIVFAAGFFLQGNPCTAQNVLGALCVCAGAALYAWLQVAAAGGDSSSRGGGGGSNSNNRANTKKQQQREDEGRAVHAAVGAKQGEQAVVTKRGQEDGLQQERRLTGGRRLPPAR
jgi:drug/metabolite transporter (DMT)-like permease